MERLFSHTRSIFLPGFFYFFSCRAETLRSKSLHQDQSSSGVDWIRPTRMSNINHVLHLIAPGMLVAKGDLASRVVQRVGAALRALVGQMENLRTSRSSGDAAVEVRHARRRGWCCEKLVALLACVRMFRLVTLHASTDINIDLLIRGIVEMLTIAGENADPILLAQSEAILYTSLSFHVDATDGSPASASTYVLVSAAEALAKEDGDAVGMESRLSGLLKLVSMRSLADHCAEAMRAGSLDNVFAAMERTRKQQKRYTQLAEKIWSLLRRLGGH